MVRPDLLSLLDAGIALQGLITQVLMLFLYTGHWRLLSGDDRKCFATSQQPARHPNLRQLYIVKLPINRPGGRYVPVVPQTKL